MTKDLTHGSPARLILQFAIPLLFGSLFQQMYNMVDTIIVGRFLGVDALAAVGATGSLNFMMVGFCVGCCSGFSVPVAQRFGARDMHDLRCYVGNGVWLSLLFTVVMTLAMTLLCRPILQLMSTPDNILDMAYDYLVVIFLGIPAIVLYNYLSSILRAVGDSRTPVYFLIVTSILNVVLDLLLVVVIPWGVAGAAWATVLSQAVSGVLCLVYMLKKTDLLKISADEWKISGEHQKVLINMGVPMGLQFSITAIGSVILQSAVNTLGSVAVASTTAASRLSTLFVCPYECLGNTMATYAGQNLGAGKIHRVRQGCKQATIFAVIYSVAAVILMWFLGGVLVQIFISGEEKQVLDYAVQFLRWNSASYFSLGVLYILRLLIQGVGFTKLAIFSGVFEMIARIFVALVLVPVFGFVGACASNPIAWVFADCFLIPAYLAVMKRLVLVERDE